MNLLENVNLRLHIKFLFWLWFTLLCMVLNILVCVTLHYFIGSIVILYDIISNMIGVYIAANILSNHNLKCQEYIRLHNLYTKYPDHIKKYELYVMKQSLCGKIVVNQLCSEFNITL